MKLELYHRQFCGFCRKVRTAIEQSGRTDVELHDVGQEPDALERLVNEGGKNQVPCLFIDGKPMYESDDIIKWLAANPQA